MKTNRFQQDGFVIQRGVQYPVRGSGIPGSRVNVVYGRRKADAHVDRDGNWTAWLDPLDAGGPDNLVISSGTDSLVISNVCAGDVWVCSGQSNMEMTLQGADTGPADAAGATDCLLRMGRVPTTVEMDPSVELKKISWQESKPETAANFSAIGYYFGAHLRRNLNIPVGLVQCAVGATPAESWVPRYVLEDDRDYDLIFERWKRSLSVFPDPGKIYEKAFAEWAIS